MIIVSGKVTAKPGGFEAVRDMMEKNIMASRKEAGCLDYSYGRDVLEPDTIIVLEYWESMEALDAHFAQPHLTEWRAALQKAGLVSRDIRAFEISRERIV